MTFEASSSMNHSMILLQMVACEQPVTLSSLPGLGLSLNYNTSLVSISFTDTLQRSPMLMCLCRNPQWRFPCLFPSLIVPVQWWGFPGSSKLDSFLIYTDFVPRGQGVKELGIWAIIISALSSRQKQLSLPLFFFTSSIICPEYIISVHLPPTIKPGILRQTHLQVHSC